MGLINSDIPELEGTDTEIALSNLDVIERELEGLLERRIAHLTELADAIISDGGDEDVITSIVLSIKYDPDSNSNSNNVLSANLEDIKSLYSGLSITERLMIFRRIFSHLYSSKKPFSKHFFDSSTYLHKSAFGKIAYLKNSFNDAAYLAFSSLINSPTSHYEENVMEVCNCVLDGKCEYCILPIETSDDGKLLSFYRIILKCGLKINLIYDLQGRTNGDYTRYALLSRSVLPPLPMSRIRNKERYLEFIITDTASLSLSEIMTSAQLCSLELSRADTLHLRISDGTTKKYFCVSFKINHADTDTFLSYLAIDCPDFIPVGVYAKI